MKLRLFSAFLFLIICITSYASFGDEVVRPQSHEELDPSNPTHKYFRVKTAKVAWVNYASLRRDFPQLQSLSEAQTDAWILNQFAYISEFQLGLGTMRNSFIDIDRSDVREFIVPFDYGRASIAPAQLDRKSIGLIDIKGSGLGTQSKVNEHYWRAQGQLDDQIKSLDHSDGLMSLGEAFAEGTRNLAIQLAMDVANTQRPMAQWNQTVEPYFILDYGFNILKSKGVEIPAGLYGRQAHWRGIVLRSTDGNSTGIYKDDRGGKQATMSGSSIDFGGAWPVFGNLEQTFGKYNTETSRIYLDNDPQESPAWKYGHDTANYFREMSARDPQAARQAVNEHFSTMLRPVVEEWTQARKISPSEKLQRPMLPGSVYDSMGGWGTTNLRYHHAHVRHAYEVGGIELAQTVIFQYFVSPRLPYERPNLLAYIENYFIWVIDKISDATIKAKRYQTLVNELELTVKKNGQVINAELKARVDKSLESLWQSRNLPALNCAGAFSFFK